MEEESGDVRQRAVISMLKGEATAWPMEEAGDAIQRDVIGMLKGEATA